MNKPKVAKIAISLPNELLAMVERACRHRRENRSAFVRQAIESFLRQEQERQAVARYRRGYHDHPETPEEVAAWSRVAVDALAQEPWG